MNCNIICQNRHLGLPDGAAAYCFIYYRDAIQWLNDYQFMEICHSETAEASGIVQKSVLHAIVCFTVHVLHISIQLLSTFVDHIMIITLFMCSHRNS